MPNEFSRHFHFLRTVGILFFLSGYTRRCSHSHFLIRNSLRQLLGYAYIVSPQHYVITIYLLVFWKKIQRFYMFDHIGALGKYVYNIMLKYLPKNPYYVKLLLTIYYNNNIIENEFLGLRVGYG